MAGPTNFEFTTGSTNVPDIGTLEYNGCSFSPLFASNLSVKVIKDDANRAVKYSEIVLAVDGYVTTLGNAPGDINSTMSKLYTLLTAQGGNLIYKGRGFDLVVNPQGGGGGGGGVLVANLKPIGGVGTTRDVAWGPVPELMEFQPMGGGLSAKVQWKVTIRIPTLPPGSGFVGVNGNGQLLQFNYDSGVVFGEDGFSGITLRGTLEIPMTRQTQGTRTVFQTADDFRAQVAKRVMSGIDLGRFRITHREFNISRDKRTLTWIVNADEMPFMDLPPYCTIARGTFTVKPAKNGPALATWLCTLNTTYTLVNNVGRRQSYTHFMAMLRIRMADSEFSNIPEMGTKKDQNPPKPGDGWFLKFIKKAGAVAAGVTLTALGHPIAGTAVGIYLWPSGDGGNPTEEEVENNKKAVLLDFSISEGLYLDSKTVSFSATWRITTTFSHILMASGVWDKLAETTKDGKNLWATTTGPIMGHKSWLENRASPKFDMIIDFGASE